MRVCLPSMPSCSKKRASSLFTTALISQIEMRLSGTSAGSASPPAPLPGFAHAGLDDGSGGRVGPAERLRPGQCQPEQGTHAEDAEQD